MSDEIIKINVEQIHENALTEKQVESVKHLQAELSEFVKKIHKKLKTKNKNKLNEDALQLNVNIVYGFQKNNDEGKETKMVLQGTQFHCGTKAFLDTTNTILFNRLAPEEMQKNKCVSQAMAGKRPEIM